MIRVANAATSNALWVFFYDNPILILRLISCVRINEPHQKIEIIIIKIVTRPIMQYN